jgi:hypothetical protein
MSNFKWVMSVCDLPPVSTRFTVASPPTVNRSAAATAIAETPTVVAVTKVLGALLLLLPLGACNDHSLTEMLNGGSAASATSTDRTPYQVGNTVTATDLARLKNYAPGQTTFEMHQILKSPDSFDENRDYYRTADGGTIAVEYDADGKWTGKTESVPSVQWQASRYPGGQP